LGLADHTNAASPLIKGVRVKTTSSVILSNPLSMATIAGELIIRKIRAAIHL